MRNVTVVILVLFLAGMSIVSAQTSPMVVADGVATNSPLYYNHTPNIARSSSGDLVAVWKSAESQIVYSKYDPAFQTWSPAVPLSNAGSNAEKAGIVADDAGNLYCVWQQRETKAQDYAVFFSKYDGTNWSSPVNLTGNDVENEECSIEVSDKGEIFVAWNTDAEKDSLEFVLCIKSNDGGASWSTPDTLSSLDGIIGGTSTTSGRPYLARATNGKMVCAWHEEPDGHPDREIMLNQYDGSQWTGVIQHIDVADSANTMYPAVAVDSNDEIYMAYVSFKSPAKLLFKKKAWDDGSWPAQADTIVNGDVGVTKPVLGIDSDNNIYLAFRRDNAADTTYGMEEIVITASGDGGATWKEQTRLSRQDYDAGYVTLATRITESGVDLLWREGFKQFVDDPDTTSIVYGHYDSITGLESAAPAIARQFSLAQNYPNPFNPQTHITFQIHKAGTYELSIYNITGEKITVLKSGKMIPGSYSVTWNARDQKGIKVASGVYFYHLSSKEYSITKKMVLLQ